MLSAVLRNALPSLRWQLCLCVCHACRPTWDVPVSEGVPLACQMPGIASNVQSMCSRTYQRLLQARRVRLSLAVPGRVPTGS